MLQILLPFVRLVITLQRRYITVACGMQQSDLLFIGRFHLKMSAHYYHHCGRGTNPSTDQPMKFSVQFGQEAVDVNLHDYSLKDCQHQDLHYFVQVDVAIYFCKYSSNCFLYSSGTSLLKSEHLSGIECYLRGSSALYPGSVHIPLSPISGVFFLCPF